MRLSFTFRDTLYVILDFIVHIPLSLIFYCHGVYSPFSRNRAQSRITANASATHTHVPNYHLALASHRYYSRSSFVMAIFPMSIRSRSIVHAKRMNL